MKELISMRVHMCEVQNIFFLITTSVIIIIIYNDNNDNDIDINNTNVIVIICNILIISTIDFSHFVPIAHDTLLLIRNSMIIIIINNGNDNENINIMTIIIIIIIIIIFIIIIRTINLSHLVPIV